MLNTNDAHTISELFYQLDTNVRNDLSKGVIADERDCVSRLVSHLNYPFGILTHVIFKNLSFKSEWFAQVNPGFLERKFGCDFMIVFEVNNQIKIALIEAKWPRVIKDPKYKWDYTQKSNKISHFSDQILRQSNWSDQAFIWEMFFYEEKPNIINSPFDQYASTCIPHQFALSEINSNSSLMNLWNNNDLKTLIQKTQNQGYQGRNETNLKTMIYNLLICNYGKPIQINESDGAINLVSENLKEEVRIPRIDFNEQSDARNNDIVSGFLEKTGLKMFQYIKIENRK
jgi:hypothetical protein